MNPTAAITAATMVALSDDDDEESEEKKPRTRTMPLSAAKPPQLDKGAVWVEKDEEYGICRKCNNEIGDCDNYSCEQPINDEPKKYFICVKDQDGDVFHYCSKGCFEDNYDSGDEEEDDEESEASVTSGLTIGLVFATILIGILLYILITSFL
jgi:hypothetical protein